MSANQIRLLQNFALLLKIFKLLFGNNCTEIDQSQLNINSVYIIIMIIIAIIMETFMNNLVQKSY